MCLTDDESGVVLVFSEDIEVLQTLRNGFGLSNESCRRVRSCGVYNFFTSVNALYGLTIVDIQQKLESGGLWDTDKQIVFELIENMGLKTFCNFANSYGDV